MSEDSTVPLDGDEPIVVGQGDDGDRPSSRGPTAIILIVLLVVIVGAATLAIGLLTGSGLESLDAIPDDVDMVVTMDLLQLTESDKVDSLIQAFARPMEDAGYIESSDIDLAGQLDQLLQDEFGLSLEGDLLTWVGRSMAIGLWLPASLDGAAEPDVVFSMSIRDGEAAADFIRSVGEPVDETELDDGTVYTFGDGSSPVIWVGQDLMIITSDRTTLRAALDARGGGSLGSDQTFAETISRLPDDHLAIAYIGPSFFESIASATSGLAPGMSLDTGAVEGLRGLAFSLALPDTGVRFDVVQLRDAGASADAVAPADFEDVASLPADTVGYIDFVLAEGQVQTWLDQIREADPAGYDDMVASATAELGVDLFGEVLPSIGGENLLAVINDRDGMLAQESGVPLGILLSLGLTDTGPMEELAASVESIAAEQGVVIRSGQPSVALMDGSEVLAYDVTDDALVAGTSSSLVGEFLDGVGGLTDTSLYEELNGDLPGDGLALYVDMGRIFDMIDMTPQDRAIAAPLRGLGASYDVDEESVTGSFLMLIDYLSD